MTFKELATNRVFIGIVAVIIVFLAVLFAYNANQGTSISNYTLTAQFPNASGLVKGNDVRIAGTRVGIISDLTLTQKDNGVTLAVAKLKLKKKLQPLPEDSRVQIRTLSTLGLKYVEIIPGYSTVNFKNGARIPLVNTAQDPVDIEQVLNMFDGKTRAAVRTNITAIGNGFAGRGEAINLTIANLGPLFDLLAPVARNLSSNSTQLGNFIHQTSVTASILAPVAQTFGELFGNLNVTFAALAAVAVPFIVQTIAQGPGTLTTLSEQLPAQVPFLRNAASLASELRPGISALRAAAPNLASALIAGIPALRNAPPFNRRLAETFRTINQLAENQNVPLGIQSLITLVETLNPTLQFVAPAQTTCNYITLFFRNTASLLSEGDGQGTWQRFLISVTPIGPNAEGVPASAPANGPSVENHLHYNPYPNTASPGQPKECEAGNETYMPGRTVIGNPPGNQGTNTEKTEGSVR